MSESVFDQRIIMLQGIILLSLRSVTCGESRYSSFQNYTHPIINTQENTVLCHCVTSVRKTSAVDIKVLILAIDGS